MNAPATELLTALRAAFPTPRGWPFVLAAALWALAGVESEFTLGKLGDGGASSGLFQVNGRGRVPAFSIASEIEFVRPVVNEKMLAVVHGIRNLFERSHKGARLELDRDALRDWLNIAWQFGDEALESWTRRADRHDYRGAAWALEMAPGRKFTPEMYLARLKDFDALYRVAVNVP